MTTTFRLRENRLLLSSVNESFLLSLSSFEGRRWHKDLHAWSLSPSIRSINYLQQNGYSPQDAITKWYCQHIPSYSTDTPSHLGTYKLFDYQRDGVSFLNTRDFALLHDAPGVGKTLQAIAWARNDETGLVVCPKAVVSHWESYFKDVWPKFQVDIYPRELREGHWGITTWNRLDISVPLGFTLIPDEVHFAKNMKSQRSRALHNLAGRAGRVLALSGTPLINRPLELWSIFLLLRERNRDDYWRFVQHYCAAYHNGYGWDVSGASNLDDLHQEMLHFSLRRTLEEVAPQLPPKRYETVHIQLREKEKALISERERKVIELVSGKALLSSEGLGALQRLRVASAKAKANYVNEWLTNHSGTGGGPVAVFCAFKEPLATALKGQAAVFYTGDETVQERTAAIQALDKGEAQVIGLTYGAGGTGLDGLQRTVSTVSLLDLPWTPAEAEQAEDRVHRIGQGKPVQVVRFVCDSWIDGKLDEANERKIDVVKCILEE